MLQVAYSIGLRDCTGLTGASFATLSHLAPTLRSLEFQAIGRVIPLVPPFIRLGSCMPVMKTQSRCLSCRVAIRF